MCLVLGYCFILILQQILGYFFKVSVRKLCAQCTFAPAATFEQQGCGL